MKRKLLLITVIAMMLICVFAISVGASELERYCDVKLTFTDNTTVTAYCEIYTWNNMWVAGRDNLYKTLNTEDGTYSWKDVKVVDFRDFNYTEGYAPKALQGLNCNGDAINVTTVYLPSTTTIILNTSFTSSWKSLETVYIPAAVEEFQYNAFSNSPVSNLILENNSQLKSIGRDALRGCKFTSFDFSKTQMLEAIGYCAFYTTPLAGNIVLPNSVTKVEDGAFRATKVESISFGDGPISLGYNIVGDESGTSKANLQSIYLSAETTFYTSSLSSVWFGNSSILNFYVVGNNDNEIDAFINTLKTTGRVKFATEDEVANGATGYNAVIYKCYNRCEIFYDNKHQAKDNGTLKYTDAVSEFYKSTECAVCGTEIKTSQVYEPIITLCGYSIKDDGTALCVGYSVNKNSYKVYTEEFGGTLKYGVIVAASDEANSFIEAKNGEVSVIEGKKAILAEIGTEYSSFELKMTGFTEATFNTALVMCAYGFDGESIKYLYDTSIDTPYTVTYNQVLNKSK